jgi:hypothetical protein
MCRQVVPSTLNLIIKGWYEILGLVDNTKHHEYTMIVEISLVKTIEGVPSTFNLIVKGWYEILGLVDNAKHNEYTMIVEISLVKTIEGCQKNSKAIRCIPLL